MGLSRTSTSGATVASSRPDRWLSPHQSLDPCMRRQTYGAIKPMDWSDRPFWRRLIGG